MAKLPWGSWTHHHNLPNVSVTTLAAKKSKHPHLPSQIPGEHNSPPATGTSVILQPALHHNCKYKLVDLYGAKQNIYNFPQGNVKKKTFNLLISLASKFLGQIFKFSSVVRGPYQWQKHKTSSLKTFRFWVLTLNSGNKYTSTFSVNLQENPALFCDIKVTRPDPPISTDWNISNIFLISWKKGFYQIRGLVFWPLI